MTKYYKIWKETGYCDPCTGKQQQVSNKTCIWGSPGEGDKDFKAAIINMFKQLKPWNHFLKIKGKYDDHDSSNREYQ